jgi:hypothetical protein
LRAFEADGAPGLASKRRGRANNHQIPSGFREISRQHTGSRGKSGPTQFARSLGELNVDIICANTPAAKGRVERASLTLQDRLSLRREVHAWRKSIIAPYLSAAPTR